MGTALSSRGKIALEEDKCLQSLRQTGIDLAHILDLGGQAEGECGDAVELLNTLDGKRSEFNVEVNPLNYGESVISKSEGNRNSDEKRKDKPHRVIRCMELKSRESAKKSFCSKKTAASREDLFSQDAQFQVVSSNSFPHETTGLTLNPGRDDDDHSDDDLVGTLRRRLKRTTWLSIFLGQVLSGILCASAITSVYLTDTYNIHVPNAQNFAFYITLATIFTTILACRPAERNLFPVLKMRGWKYALVALADAEANFLVVKAYRYTTLTSVQLLDCFTIPTVLSLSWLVLRIRYKVAHILGVSICLLGVCCLVWADIEEGRPLSHGKDRFFGDMLCLSGAFLYGVSNVAQEFVVHSFDLVEFLGMVGLFGSFVSGAQTVLLEYTEVTTAEWGGITGIPVLLLMGFALAQLAFYVLAAFVIKLAGATSYNISILTADFYSLIVGIYLFQYKFHALYFLSFVLVMSGVIVFSIKPTVLDSHVYRDKNKKESENDILFQNHNGL